MTGGSSVALLCDPQSLALARCAGGVRAAQDDLQPVYPVEPSGRVQPYLRRTRSPGREARPTDGRCNLPEGAADSGQCAQKGAVPRRIGRTKGGLHSKLHSVRDDRGRPRVMLLTEGQMIDYKSAALTFDAVPRSKRAEIWQRVAGRLDPGRHRTAHHQTHHGTGKAQTGPGGRRRRRPRGERDANGATQSDYRAKRARRPLRADAAGSQGATRPSEVKGPISMVSRG